MINHLISYLSSHAELSQEEISHLEECIPVETFQKGDVLSEIAIRFGVTVDSINKTNNLENKSIFPGQIIRIEI